VKEKNQEASQEKNLVENKVVEKEARLLNP